MEEYDNWFLEIRNIIFRLMKEKTVDIDALAFDLNMDKDEVINNFANMIDDYSFYLKTLHLLENWEG